MGVTQNWLLFLAAVAGVSYYYWNKNQTQSGGRPRGASVGQPKGTATASKSKAAPKPKAKAPKKTVKKTVQDVADKAANNDVVAPIVEAVKNTAAKVPQVPQVSGKDVADMLPSAGAAANVLRINPSEKAAGANKPQKQRSEAPQETKKQRQNRKKKEEEKQQREADEKERQVLLEQQRRTAREARGEPAKNGLQSTKPPAKSAWASDRPASEVLAPPQQNGQLLDTFDPDVASPAGPNGAGANGTAHNANGMTGDLTEEDQVRMAMEETSWETVPKGKKQKKTKPAEEASEEETGAASPQEAVPVKQAPVKQAPVKKTENKQPQSMSRYDVLSAPDVRHPMDSDWSVV